MSISPHSVITIYFSWTKRYVDSGILFSLINFRCKILSAQNTIGVQVFRNFPRAVLADINCLLNTLLTQCFLHWQSFFFVNILGGKIARHVQYVYFARKFSREILCEIFDNFSNTWQVIFFGAKVDLSNCCFRYCIDFTQYLLYTLNYTFPRRAHNRQAVNIKLINSPWLRLWVIELTIKRETANNLRDTLTSFFFKLIFCLKRNSYTAINEKKKTSLNHASS